MLEQKVYQVDQTIESPNGEVNGAVALVDASGDPVGVVPALPTANGEYTLTITDGVASWTSAA